MDDLFRYAESRNVGIVPWVIWKTLDDQLAEAMDRFTEPVTQARGGMVDAVTLFGRDGGATEVLYTHSPSA